MATNSAPRIKGADEGIWSRIRRVDWTRFFTEDERDPWLTHKLAEEAPGILNWVIEGARLWYESGLGEPEVVKTASRNYRHTSDELLGFIGTVVIEDDDGSINGSDLMGQYLDWAIDENVRPWSRRALYEAIVERVEGVRKVKKSDGVHLVGIRLATDDDRGGDDE
jgi:putative DNA primase/helicase